MSALRGPLVVALLALLAACRAERTLTVTSEPPGALVRLGEEVVGTTPLTLEFQHYGTRRVTVTLEGHRTESRRIEMAAPWQARFPIDFVSEVILPVGWEDHHLVHVDLLAGDANPALPELSSVLRRAEALRRAGPDGPRELPPALPSAPAGGAPRR